MPIKNHRHGPEMIRSSKVIRYLILLLGLLAYTFSGLNWNVGITAWIAPALLLFYSRSSKWSGLLFLFLGLAFCSAVSKTAENVSGVFIIYITTGLSYGFLYCLPYLIDKHVVKKGVKFYSTLIFPSAVVSVEYVLSQLIGIWGNGAIAQFHNSNLIQISSVFGVFGISFLIAWFGSTLNWVVENGIKSKRLWTGLVIYGTVLSSVLLFGVIRQKSLPEAEDTVKVATIVGVTDIQQVYEDWEENIIGLSKNYAQEIPADIYSDSSDLEAMINRTDKALSNGAKIVVWNEISLLLMPSQTGSLVEKVKDLCAKYQAFVLIAVLEKNAGDLPKPFNNISILVDPECQILWNYQKYYLSHERLVTNTGSGPIPFADTEYGRIANTICADLDFSAYISQVGKESVDILLVPAFDWEEVTHYHAQMAAFAAIQYGVSIVRANGKGIAALYDTRGNIIAQSNTFKSDTKVNFAELPIIKATSIYSSIGDCFVYVWMVFLLIMIGLGFSKRVDI